MLLETDALCVAPAPFRGKPNESSLLPRMASRLAAEGEDALARRAELRRRLKHLTTEADQ